MTESTLMPALTDFFHTQQPAGPSDSAMHTLYRAALGPVRPESYLPRFERFDALGRTQPGWNWAACLCTLNWMALRHLWTPALIYVAAAEGLGLLLFGAIRTLLPWPEPVQWGLVGAFALLAFVLPGLYGDAILHTEVRKRIARALASTRSLPDACAQLEQQAATPRRLAGLAALNVALLGAAGLAFWLLPHTSPSPAPADSPSAQAAAALPPASQTTAVPAPPAASAPAAPTYLEASAASAPVAPMPDLEPAPAIPASASAVPAQVASASRTPTRGPSEKPTGTATTAHRAAPAPTPTPAKPAPAVATRPTATASAPSPGTSNRAAPAISTASAPAPVGSAPGYYINVGLFAEEANARRAQAKLLNAGLPAFRQSLDTPKGQRIRVRVGPYPSAAQAQAAARSIKALQLDAVVFRQSTSPE